MSATSTLRDLSQWSQSLLTARKDAGLLREWPLPHAVGIDFASNDYLGLARLPFPPSPCPSGSGASRVVHAHSHHASLFEQDMSSWMGAEGTCLFPSAFQANLALWDILSHLSQEAQKENKPFSIFLDHRNHASLMAGPRFSSLEVQHFRHNDFQDLENRLNKAPQGVKIVILESLHSMEGTFPSAKDLARILSLHGAGLWLDEAHSTGICGPEGMGWWAQCPLPLQKSLLGVTLGFGKAWGLQGGALVGFQGGLVPLVPQLARSFLFTTGVIPALANALSQRLSLLRSPKGEALRLQLRQSLESFHLDVREPLAQELPLGWSWQGDPHSPIQSLCTQTPDRAVGLALALQAEGLHARAIRPPTVPKGTSRIRLILQAQHSSDDRKQLRLGLLKALRALA